jgi:FAD/FMN-containing dehydrogenase
MRYAIWNDYVATEVESIARPRDAEEVAACVHRARELGKCVKAVGAGHSFNDLSLTHHVLVDLRELSQILSVDLDARTVRVQGGMPLASLIVALDQLGLSLPNIGAWTEQTVAGVLSTATHGTGGRYKKSLVEAAVEIRLVDGLGEERVLRGAELAYLTLGFFGIITEVVLRCEPLFYVRQSNLVQPGATAIDGFAAELASHDFVDLRWVGSLPRVIVRRWDIVPGPPNRLDQAARLYEGVKLHALNKFLALLNAQQLSRTASERMFGGLASAYIDQGKGIANTSVWHEGLTFNSLGMAAPHEEREFAVPVERSAECLHTLRSIMLGDPGAASLEVQVRYSPSVNMALAPNDGRDTVWFNLNVMTPAHTAELVERVSRAVYDFAARPHWAKVIPACTPDVRKLYGTDLARWELKRLSYDPEGLFLNDWYHRHLGQAARSVLGSFRVRDAAE